MTRFKKCSMENCHNVASKPYKMLKMKSDEEEIGVPSKPIKLIVCKTCFEDYKGQRFIIGEQADPLNNPLVFKNVKVVDHSHE